MFGNSKKNCTKTFIARVSKMHGNKKCPSFFLFLAKLTSMLYKNFVRENVVDDLFMGFKGKPLIFFMSTVSVKPGIFLSQ